MVAHFPAPSVPLDDLDRALRDDGYAVLEPASVVALAGVGAGGFDGLLPSWDDLPQDDYLKDGGRYRKRRHASFIAEAGALVQVPPRRHWQPVEYNALHGGMERWFAPVTPAVVAHPAWSKLVLAIADACSRCKPAPRWHVEAHQFRIDTTDGLGRPTPEGAHRDGVDFVAVLLVSRSGIKGGETRVFDANGPRGQRFTLDAPWSMLLMDDARVIHESTPIQPIGTFGHRDTLVLTYRAAAFLGDD
ncbi:MAG TPA: 2OG-Fe dioxygenase family protein [Thermomonas sp.]|jgi:hypothetical protein|uniref:2OG-Fe dioxygenase family protein n=1 Tax=Thermomonas sp. TaxID=1971895 RepID=UPI002C367116|nr:2OG-Fe dioxygenase family protein [Thermomonas sp.]HPM55988.1 2OG-Fe dioxygenase family protein [Thermomonas sp.]